MSTDAELHQMLGELKASFSHLNDTMKNMVTMWGNQERDASAGRRVIHEKVDALKDSVTAFGNRVASVEKTLPEDIKPAVEEFKDQRQQQKGAMKLGKLLQAPPVEWQLEAARRDELWSLTKQILSASLAIEQDGTRLDRQFRVAGHLHVVEVGVINLDMRRAVAEHGRVDLDHVVLVPFQHHAPALRVRELLLQRLAARELVIESDQSVHSQVDGAEVEVLYALGLV